MPAEVNESLATLSDQLILATVLLYLVAMICYALDLAFGRARTVVAVRRRQLVGAGGPAAPEDTTGDAAEDSGPQPATWAVRAGTIGVVLTWIAWAATSAASSPVASPSTGGRGPTCTSSWWPSASPPSPRSSRC
ncbi:hypothetical protein GCM10027612_14200 [Microbispora bryophytorum subsp. camponoti]